MRLHAYAVHREGGIVLRILRIVLTALIAAFLAFSPPYILGGLDSDPYGARWGNREPAWRGRIELWHVATFRTYQGKVTRHLEKRAEAYCRQNPGVHIEVFGYTEAQFADRIARGVYPDAYSFQTGLLYAEQLAPLPTEEDDLPAFRGNLAPALSAGGETLAAPYLMSGYCVCVNAQLSAALHIPAPDAADGAFLQAAAQRVHRDAPQLCMPPVLAARAGVVGALSEQGAFLKGKAAFAVLDARARSAISCAIRRRTCPCPPCRTARIPTRCSTSARRAARAGRRRGPWRGSCSFY